MDGTTLVKAPAACTEAERREFVRLVRDGFRSNPDTLAARVGRAHALAFHRDARGGPGGIAALKAPDEAYRVDVFRKADAPVSATDHDLEVGWVYVVPASRRTGIGGQLCRELIALVPGAGVFATTRPDNVAMIDILVRLGFARAGRPYARGDEALALFVLSPATRAAAPGP